MVTFPEGWKRSSYLATAGALPVPQWLTTKEILGRFGNERKTAHAEYVDFVRAGTGGEPVWKYLRHQTHLRNEKFVKQMLKRESGIKDVKKEMSHF